MTSPNSRKLGLAGNLRKLRHRLEPYALLFPALAILALFFAGAVLYNIFLSLQHVSLFQLRSGGEWVGLDNYASLVRDKVAWLALKNTVVWLTAATVILRLILGLILALLLNAAVLRRWRLSGLARTLLLIPWITPQVVAVAAWTWLLEPRYGAINQILIKLGVVDSGIPFLAQTSTVWGAIITIVVWRELPFVVISFLAGLQSVPADLQQAARVDGASEWRVLYHVTLPLLRPVIVVVALLTTIWTFNNFVYVWLSTQGGPGNYTQVLATYEYTTAFTNYHLGLGAAIGMLMGVIMLVFSLVYFRVVFREE